jgi:hypothetical protein
MTLRVAIVGDSAVWGQGLKPEHQFARLAAERIAADLGEPLEILPGPGREPGRGHPRSGAKIRDKVDEGDPVAVLLPSGASTMAPPGDRANFALTFRSLFESDQEMRDFLDGSNERPAARLFGEHPAAFPTVIGQLRELTEDGSTADVRLVILNGGANDINFEEVLDPEGPAIKAIDQEIQKVFRGHLTRLLTETRRTFPNAVIVVVGYFPALTKGSDRADLKNLFEFISEKPEWQLAVNDVIQQIPFFNDLFNAIGLGKDVPELVEKAVRRSVFAVAHAHFWTRVTIRSLPASMIGPGIVYAYPAFRSEHGLFAGDRSLLHSGYKPPGHGRLSVADEMLETRLQRIPRLDLLDEYRGIRSDCGRLLTRRREEEDPNSDGVPPGEDSAVLRDRLRDRLRTLVENNPDLPSQVLLIRGLSSDAVSKLINALGSEIGRIEIAIIASFIHPNRAGDERYADRIVAAYNRHQRFSVRTAVRGMAPAGQRFQLRKALLQHGVDPAQGLRQLIPVALIESVAIELSGLQFEIPAPPVPIRLERKIKLTLGTAVEINFTIPVLNGNTDLLRAFDTGAGFALSKLTDFTIEMEDATDFQIVTLFLNGHEFFRARPDQANVEGDIVRFTLEPK